MSTPVLELVNVSKLYGPRLIFKKLNLSLEAGRLLLLTGANGAGKSTLLRLMGGLAKPTSGLLRIYSRQRPVYLGHATWLYPDLTARENLAFWSKTSGAHPARQQMDDILEKMRLSASANLKTRHFSRGMAQKLNFARILLLKPDILLLDEPFTGLDSDFQQLLRAEISNIKNQGAAIVLVSHQLETDLPLANSVASIHAQRLNFSDPETARI